jgi:hypothetical protein
MNNTYIYFLLFFIYSKIRTSKQMERNDWESLTSIPSSALQECPPLRGRSSRSLSDEDPSYHVSKALNIPNDFFVY